MLDHVGDPGGFQLLILVKLVTSSNTSSNNSMYLLDLDILLLDHPYW